MNTFSKILLSSVVGLTSIFGMVGEAEARPYRTVHFETSRGTEVYFSPVGSNGVRVTVNNNYNGSGFLAVRHCGTGEYSWSHNDGYTQTQIRNITRDACNY